MYWYHYLLLFSALIFLGSSLFIVARLIRLGKPVDHASAAGDTRAAIRYSFTGAMSPSKKESAYLHLPTYTAGIVFHLGTFLSVLLFFFIWVPAILNHLPVYLIVGFLLLSACCGLGILVKRMVRKLLRDLSCPDDYISNSLVTLFQLTSGLVILNREYLPLYAVISSLLLIYFPLGKLKHALYFFAARYHLGVFYGSRAVWPPKSTTKE